MVFYFKVGPAVLGRKHIEAARFWMPSVIGWGASAVVFICHLTDVTTVMAKIPFYKEGFRYPYEDDKIISVIPVFPIPK